MKKQYFFLVSIMLWMFSSVSFASMVDSPMDQSPALSLSYTKGNVSTDLTISVLDHKSFMLAEEFIFAAFGHHGSFGGDFGHEHHEHYGNHEHHWHFDPKVDDGPAAVPLPPAIWLFGSAIAGLLGVCRKSSLKAIAV